MMDIKDGWSERLEMMDVLHRRLGFRKNQGVVEG